MSRRLDAILRAALDDISDMPLKVSDERWMQKLDIWKASKLPL